MADELDWWQRAMAGQRPPIHEGEPQCGYFKMRDRRGPYRDVAPIKRPFVACAIWRDESGQLVAEFAGSPVPVDHLWPYAAKYPVTYEEYRHWHDHAEWPGEAA